MTKNLCNENCLLFLNQFRKSLLGSKIPTKSQTIAIHSVEMTVQKQTMLLLLSSVFSALDDVVRDAWTDVDKLSSKRPFESMKFGKIQTLVFSWYRMKTL